MKKKRLETTKFLIANYSAFSLQSGLLLSEYTRGSINAKRKREVN